jgi:hypothetical protein
VGNGNGMSAVTEKLELPVIPAGMHVHWVIWAYKEFDAPSDRYLDSTSVDVIAEGRAEALQLAALLVPKKGPLGGYRVAQVAMYRNGSGQCH